MRQIAIFLSFASNYFGAALLDAIPTADTCGHQADIKGVASIQSRSKLVQDAVLEAHDTADVQCLLLEEDIEYTDHEEAFWTCQLDSGIVLKIVGLRDEWVVKHADRLISGRTRLGITQAMLNATTLTIPDRTDPTIVEVVAALALVGVTIDPVNPNTPLQGDRSVLVLKVIANDAEPDFTAKNLGDYVFGTLGDAINLKERFNSCSYGQYTMTPFSGTTTTGYVVEEGVVEVTIDMDVSGEDPGAVENAVTLAAKQLLGPITQFDHVMQVLPAGTTVPNGDWIGYAYPNGRKSVYNNLWGSYVSLQVHEIGHNLMMHHAGESTEYDDQSGYMGYSYAEEDFPVMCYNGAKNWQFAWYTGAYALADPRETEWSGELIGIASYQEAGSGMYVVLKLETGTETDYYVSFNSKHGINAGTMEGGNKILVHTTGGDGIRTNYTKSVLEAKLDQGASFDISDFGGTGDTVTITVDSIDTGASPPIATVTISNPSLPTPTNAPTSAPTSAPTLGPTSALWPSTRSSTKCVGESGNKVVDRRACQEIAEKAGYTEYAYSDTNGRCATYSSCDEYKSPTDQLWNIYELPTPPATPAPASGLWPSTRSSTKCVGQSGNKVVDRRACQEKAEKAGYTEYAYSDTNGRCATYSSCDEYKSPTDQLWNIYEQVLTSA